MLSSKYTALVVLLACGSMPARAQRNEQGDQTFVTRAVQISNGEVLLAKIAAEKSTSPDVKQFAQRLMGEQTQLGQVVAPLAQQVSATLRPGEISAAQQRAATRLQALSGVTFDRDFIRSQIDELTYALHIYQSEIATTQDPGLKQTAATGARVITAHLRLAGQLAQARQIPLSARPATVRTAGH